MHAAPFRFNRTWTRGGAGKHRGERSRTDRASLCVCTLTQKGILDKYNIELIGAKLDAINKAGDRELFKLAMVGRPPPCSRFLGAPRSL